VVDVIISILLAIAFINSSLTKLDVNENECYC